jgi:lipoprotein
MKCFTVAGLAAALGGCSHTSKQGSASSKGGKVSSNQQSGASESSKFPGDALAVTPKPKPIQGASRQLVDGVAITLPTELSTVKTYGPKRLKAYYFRSHEDVGLLDINWANFVHGETGVEASSQWKAYRDDTSTTSTLVQVQWPNADEAWAWTWDQVADFSELDSSFSKGASNLSAASMVLKTVQGQDVYIAAYAPEGSLADSPAFNAMCSLVLS